MINLSRRSLARYAADQIVAGARPAVLALQLAAALKLSGRGNEVEPLLSDIDLNLEERGLVARVKVTTAKPLATNLQAQIGATIKQLAGVKKVIIEPRIDETILGGIKIETAGRVWDKSLKKLLAEIKAEV